MKSNQRLTGRRGLVVIVLTILSATLLANPAGARSLAQEPVAAITSPADGQQLSGIVEITGSANHPEFDRYELAYGPDPNPNDAWQPFSSNPQPVLNDVLGRWDTTKVADGGYMLRLRVVRKDSNYQEAFIRGLHVANQQAQASPTPSGPEPTFPPEATLNADANAPVPTGETQPVVVSTVLVEQPPTSVPAATTNVTATPADRANARSNATGSLLDTSLFASSCFNGALVAAFAFGVLGAVQLSRAVYKQVLRAERARRKKSKQHADSGSITPPSNAG